MAECPFCEYEGSTSSVEAHISGSGDDAHSGRLGSNHRGLIQGSVSSSDESVEESGGADQPADLAPSVALVAASAVLIIIVVAGSAGSADSAESTDQPAEDW
jgi:hypothetical protein